MKGFEEEIWQNFLIKESGVMKRRKKRSNPKFLIQIKAYFLTKLNSFTENAITSLVCLTNLQRPTIKK